MSTVLIPCP